MIRLNDLTLARGANRLLEGASMTVHAGHRVLLVWPVVDAAVAEKERAHSADGRALAELHQRYEAIGGYAPPAR